MKKAFSSKLKVEVARLKATYWPPIKSLQTTLLPATGLAQGLLHLLGLAAASLLRPSERVNVALFKYASVYMLAALALISLASGCLAGPPAAPTAAPRAEPLAVTRQDSGQTLRLRVGERLRLELEEYYLWTVSVSDAAVLDVVEDGAQAEGQAYQATFQALAAGEVELNAAGDTPCRRNNPHCGAPQATFHLTVIVEP